MLLFSRRAVSLYLAELISQRSRHIHVNFNHFFMIATSDGKNTATASLTQYSIQTESTTETATISNRSKVDSLSTGEIESNSTVSEPTNFRSTGFQLPENEENKSNSFDRRPPQHRPLDVIREASSGLEEGTIKSTSEESVIARRKITNGDFQITFFNCLFLPFVKI